MVSIMFGKEHYGLWYELDVCVEASLLPPALSPQVTDSLLRSKHLYQTTDNHKPEALSLIIKIRNGWEQLSKDDVFSSYSVDF